MNDFDNEHSYAQLICAMFPDRHGRGNHLANARLIAAAPDLLDELKALLVAVTYATPPVDFGTPDDPNPCFEARVPVEFVTRAQAAISKATQPTDDGQASGMNP